MTKLVCGVGVNDADYVVQPTVRGVKISCPIYAIWFQMLQRCYTRYGRIHNPTYSENTVCNDWLLFSNYRLWYTSNHENGLDVDKDILIKGK